MVQEKRLVKVAPMALLILARHGQSQWNLENRFTGWVDIELTDQGRQEAHAAASKIKGTPVDAAFTSKLKRAAETLEIILKDLGIYGNVPVAADQALNERHYGSLQGMNKDEAAKRFGEAQVKTWRRSYDVPPPDGEALKDTAARTLPYFRSKILPLLNSGKNALVVAHGNSLRSIIMEIEKLTPEQILKVELETGVPRFYDVNGLDFERRE